MRKQLFVLCIVLITISILNAGWYKYYGGFTDDMAYSVQQTPEGGFILVGSTKSFGVGTPDYPNVYLIKTDGFGDTLWTRTYGGEQSDQGYWIELTNDGNYIVTGATNSSGAGGFDVYVAKISHDGELLWSDTYGGANDDYGYCIKKTADGGYIVGGYSKSFGSGDNDYYLLKLDAEGNEVWSNTYGGGGDDKGYSVQQTADGGYIIAGYTDAYVGERDNIYVVKTDNDGNSVWEQAYGEAGHDQAFSIQQTADGGYIIGGFQESADGVRRDMYMVKIGSSGELEWDRTYGGDDDEFGQFVRQTSDGGYMLCGWTMSFGAERYDVYLVKTDPSGDIQWSNIYGGRGYDYGFVVLETPARNYVVAGWTLSYGFGGWNVYLLKVNPDGGMDATYTYNLSTGWNLFSYPFTDNVPIGSIFPSTSSPYYFYDPIAGNYTELSMTSAGKGFWVLSTSDETVTIEGDEEFRVEGSLRRGWNLIAGPGYTVSASFLTDLPEVIPPIYTYIDNHYVASNYLVPGLGYWVLSSGTVEYSLPPEE